MAAVSNSLYFDNDAIVEKCDRYLNPLVCNQKVWGHTCPSLKGLKVTGYNAKDKDADTKLKKVLDAAVVHFMEQFQIIHQSKRDKLKAKDIDDAATAKSTFESLQKLYGLTVTPDYN